MKRFLHKLFKNKAAKAIPVAIFWLALWKIVSLIVGKEILFPSPEVTFLHLISFFTRTDFYKSLGFSFLRITLGYLIGLVSGLVLAIASLSSGIVKSLLMPLKSVIKATPVASFIILAFVWMTKNEIPAFTSALIVVPIVWGNIISGFETIGKRELEVAKLYGFSLGKKIKYIYIPGVRNYFTSASLTAIGLSWKAGIAAEALVRTKYSIGGLLFDSKAEFESADLFALTAIVIIISVISEFVAERLIEKRKAVRS